MSAWRKSRLDEVQCALEHLPVPSSCGTVPTYGFLKYCVFILGLRQLLRLSGSMNRMPRLRFLLGLLVLAAPALELCKGKEFSINLRPGRRGFR